MPSAADPGVLIELTGVWAAGFLDATVKGTVLLLGAFLAARLLRSRPAAVRHLVWAAALTGLLCLPVLSGVLPRIEVPGLPRIMADTGVESSPAAAAAPPGMSAAAGEGSREVAGSVGGTATSGGGSHDASSPGLLGLLDRVSPASLLAGLWLLGLSLVLARAALGRLRIGWLARSAERVRDGPWPRTRDRLVRQLGLSREVTLLQGPVSTVPMTWGVLRPCILLPDEAHDWTERCRRNVLLHELAHVRRGDYLMRLVGRAVVALYWFHPLAWIALRRMRREQEQACDDYVLRAGVRPSEYAGQLVRLARGLRTIGSGAHAGSSTDAPSEFLHRMRSLLRADRPREPVSGGQLGAVGTGAALLVAGLAAMGPAGPDETAAPEAGADPPAPDLSDPVARVVGGLDRAPDDGGEPRDEPPAASPTTSEGPGTGTPAPREDRSAADGEGNEAGRAGEEESGTTDASRARATRETEVARAGAGAEEQGGDREKRAGGPNLVPDDFAGLSLRAESMLAVEPEPTLRPGFTEAVRGAGSGGAGPEAREAPGEETESVAAGGEERPAEGPCSMLCTVDEVLARLAERPDSTARIEMLRSLAHSSSDRSAAVLMKLSYRAHRPDDRRMVVRALAEVPGRVSDRYLYQVARANPWVSVRAAAIDELGRSGGERVVPWLVNLAYQDVNPEVQKFAVSVLARSEHGGVESGLVQIARSHPKDEVRDEALYWLARTGRDDVLERLVGSA